MLGEWAKTYSLFYLGRIIVTQNLALKVLIGNIEKDYSNTKNYR
jgi:hypothetical protein